MAVTSIPRVLSVVVLAAATAAAGLVARNRFLPADEVLPGVRVDGVGIERGADVRAIVEERASALRARTVKIVERSEEGERVVATVTLGELGASVDVDGAVERIVALGHEGDWLTRAAVAERARRGDIDVPVTAVIDASAVVARFAPLKESDDTAPVAARLDLDHHSVVGEKNGRYLDVYGLVDAIQRVADGAAPTATVALPFASFAPRVSSAFLSAIDISQVVGSFQTGFGRTGGHANRGRNVEVAASRLDGVVLSPGDVMSFNAVVGARSEENGFKRAGEIFKGEMIEGIGGGTCQVASTFHAAAFFGGLDVLERLPHSRPSAYIPLGLDATVVYPSIDLKIRNPYDFPIVVHAFVTGSTVHVELLGRSHPVNVSYGRDVLGTFPFTRKVVEDGYVTEPKIKQKGIKGVEIRRERVLAYVNGQRRVELSTDMYPPTTEIYRVPPGYDPETLPPVGEDPNASTKTDSREGAGQQG
jgi:vancomycin resistance protein YoaR